MRIDIDKDIVIVFCFVLLFFNLVAFLASVDTKANLCKKESVFFTVLIPSYRVGCFIFQ